MSMVVIDWLQTSEYIRANSERFILYCLCGCFIGIAIIFLMIIIVLFIEKRNRNDNTNEKYNHEYQVPRNDANYNDIFSVTNPYVPVYHYDGRSHSELYHI